MATETLTIEAAKQYARDHGLYPHRAEKVDCDGIPVIRVEVTEHDGRVTTMEVWIECGRIYGEW